MIPQLKDRASEFIFKLTSNPVKRRMVPEKVFTLEAKNLSTLDLMESRLPDTDFSISLDLIAHDKKYGIHYDTTPNISPTNTDSYSNYPRVALISKDVSIEEFNLMLKYITKINRGRSIPGRPTLEDRNNISALVHQGSFFPFTQKNIAKVIGKYSKHYNLTINRTIYENVPEHLIENPGFPKSKLTIKE